MKRSITAAIMCLVVAGLVVPGWAAAPEEIAGFELGANIDRYQDRLSMGSAFPLNDMRYLSQVEGGSVKGFKKASIVYGTCHQPGRIVRIKMKYADSTMKFYDRLLEAFKKNFGPADEWRGDAFHRFVAWKWSFKTSDDESISMILQHAQPDDLDHPSGNVVKLTNWTWVDEERRCYEKKPSKPSATSQPQNGEEGGLDFNYFIPK